MLPRTFSPAWVASPSWCAPIRPRKPARSSRATALMARPTPMLPKQRAKLATLRSRRPRPDTHLLTIQVERYRAERIGAVGLDVLLRQPLQHFVARMPE